LRPLHSLLCLLHYPYPNSRLISTSTQLHLVAVQVRLG
jgi:hypothetical protein